MPNRSVVILFAVIPVLSGGAYAAGDAAAGKTKSTVCAACHGPTGKSVSPEWPNLAGQKQVYLVKQLKAFREGTRKNPQMSPMAKTLSDADIEDLAAYFATSRAP
jgi:cytochrome c553